jgi:ABC-2 type transport system permease protein
MAVYKRNYKGYAGPLTARWSRFLILTRYSYSRLFQSRFLLMFLMLCLVYPIGCAAFIYLSHNDRFLALMRIPTDQLQAINGRFFYYYCTVQGAMAYVLTALVAPSLVSPDLVNGALPLYFCRPFSRTQYVMGKLGVLLAILSLITWVPGLLLFLIESSVTGWDWGFDNLWLAWGIFAGLLIWILVLSLIGLALSAWVKWKIAAGALLLGVFFAGAGFGSAIDSVMRTNVGALIDLTQVVHTLQADLLRYDSGTEMPVSSAWLVLGITCALSLALLARRVRAFEVVK